MMFTGNDYNDLATLFVPEYAGYKPNVREIPNGDGKVDQDKRYLHVATKYNPPAWAMSLLLEAHDRASVLARALLAPAPHLDACALRVLEYPRGAGSAEHTDFDMFTLNLWRNPVLGGWPRVHIGELGEMFGLGPAMSHSVPALPTAQYSIVFFALPNHDTALPSGGTVGTWLAERISRSRT